MSYQNKQTLLKKKQTHEKMGAGNSTPQTARIENPKRSIPIEVTPSVVTRLENAQKSQANETNSNENVKEEPQESKPSTSPQKTADFINPSRDKKRAPNLWSEEQHDDIYRKKYNEHEEYQFDKTFEQLENIIGKPIAWREDIEGEILGLRKDLIKCYNDNPGQTLHCSEIAKKYQDFIFDQQYKSIVRITNANEGAASSTSNESPPKPPYQHSPPYF
ncbi:uncharacterized protein [Musca autumnalis]|uniref:uncharacterized protein n=1 Tax=Musca autumnalis TaxID=221902 RepID=UPI003CED6634